MHWFVSPTAQATPSAPHHCTHSNDTCPFLGDFDNSLTVYLSYSGNKTASYDRGENIKQSYLKNKYKMNKNSAQKLPKFWI